MKTLLALSILALFGFAGFSHAGEVKPYPLKVCIVSDEGLDEMGKPFVFEYEGQEIKLCCKRCKSAFEKDPAKYLKKIEK